MIRFIDLRHHTEDLAGDRFAFYGTTTGTFIADDIGCQTWCTFGQFAAGYEGDEIERFEGLTPAWAKQPATRCNTCGSLCDIRCGVVYPTIWWCYSCVCWYPETAVEAIE